MAQFTLEAKTDIFTSRVRWPKGTLVNINVPASATPNTFLINPNFRNTIISQFRSQGIDISPNQLGYAFWKVTNMQR